MLHSSAPLLMSWFLIVDSHWFDSIKILSRPFVFPPPISNPPFGLPNILSLVCVPSQLGNANRSFTRVGRHFLRQIVKNYLAAMFCSTVFIFHCRTSKLFVQIGRWQDKILYFMTLVQKFTLTFVKSRPNWVDVFHTKN